MILVFVTGSACAHGEDADGVFLSDGDLDLGLFAKLDETDMPQPPFDGLWVWVDAGSGPEPPGPDSLYSEGIDWRGAWRRPTAREAHAIGCMSEAVEVEG